MNPIKSRPTTSDKNYKGKAVKSAELKLFFNSQWEIPKDCLINYLKRFFRHYYKQNSRQFPWRKKNTTAFHLLIAEILLKQTKASDVAPVWQSLTRKYCTPSALAQARKNSLFRLLKPLGLQQQRTEALISMAKAIVDDFSGRVPKEIAGLLALPYVGLYSACAVACFSYGNKVPIVDANVLRVLSRVTGDDFGRDLRRNRNVWSLAWAMLPKKNFIAHNYGLLDFSALLCKARNPECGRCSLKRKCEYGKSAMGQL